MIAPAVRAAGTLASGEPGPAVVSVNDVFPETGCPSADTTRYPIWYVPAGPSGNAPTETVWSVSVTSPRW